MPNTSSKALARIRATYEAQQAALNAKRRQQLAHLIDSPAGHWSGVRSDVLAVLRANRDALTAQEELGIKATITPVSNAQFYNPRLAPQVGSLVEHELFGLGMVEGKPFAAANAGMALAVFFDEVDRAAIVFVDELEMLDGDLVGQSTDHDTSIASRETRATIQASKAMAAKYSDTDEDEDDAAFEAFMASEFAAEFGGDDEAPEA